MTKIRSNTARRGVSLAEMCVVLALISIVSLLVTSFTLMVNTRSAVSVTKTRAADDLRLAEIVLENWIGTVINTHAAEVSVSEDGESLAATIGGIVYRAQLTENGFEAALPGGNTLHCPIGEVSTFRFEEMKKTEGEQVRDAIWFCTAEYLLSRAGEDPVPQQVTFCVNPHVGDAVL